MFDQVIILFSGLVSGGVAGGRPISQSNYIGTSHRQGRGCLGGRVGWMAKNNLWRALCFSAAAKVNVGTTPVD